MPTADLRNRFEFHPADTQDKKDAHADVRKSCLNLAMWFDKKLPETREKALAIQRLEEAMFWANASIARNS